MSVGVAYIDFWKECKGVPVELEEINNPAKWENITSSRNHCLISEGVGLFHIKTLEKILNKKLKITTPQQADIIICSVFGNEKYNYPNKKKLLLCYEPFVVPPIPNLPNTIYFSSKLSKEPNLFYLPLYVCYYGFSIYDKLREPRTITEEEFNRRGDCLSIISNTWGEYRNSFLSKLMDSIKVDNYGSFLHNKDNELIQKTCWYDPRLGLEIGKYKFMMCMENRSVPGYHTEKILHGFRNKVIPIYWGDNTCRLIFNSKAYINVNIYGIDKAIEKIKELCNDYEKYKEMIEQPIISEESVLNRSEFNNYIKEEYFREYLNKLI
jgi:hypothetical protein